VATPFAAASAFSLAAAIALRGFPFVIGATDYAVRGCIHAFLIGRSYSMSRCLKQLLRLSFFCPAFRLVEMYHGRSKLESRGIVNR
jgi:hypothetical protein